MIRCTKCQTINPDDAIFCSNCKSFLEWTGVPATPAEVAAAQAATDEDVADQLAAEQAAAEKAAAEQTAAEKVAAEQTAAEQAAAERTVADKAADRQAELDRVASEQVAAQQAAAQQAAAQQGAADKAAAEQASRDRATADKAAAEQAAAEQTAAEQTAAEQAAAEKATADQAAAEQAAAEQAAAEQAAAEQAAAEQQAAEQAAAEKAAVERAAAEQKMASERAAAARAAAEQAAADKAAADKAAQDRAFAERAAAMLAEPLPSATTIREPSEVEDEPPPARPGAVRPQAPQPAPRRPLATPPSDQPAARQPTLAVPPRPRPRPEEDATAAAIEARPGDVICPVCSTPNDPARTFCRRCGHVFAAPVIAPKAPPWWRRIFQRKRTTALAGQRPKRLGEAGQPRPGVVRRIVPVLAVAAIAFGATSLLVMPGARAFIGDTVTDLRLRFLPKIVDVIPVGASGQSVGANLAKLAIDDNTATFWLTDPATGAPTLTVDLGSTINLGGLVVHSGSSTESDFIKHRRPKSIELTFPGTDRPAVDLELKDTADPQPLSVDVRGVEIVVIRVVDWFESGTGGDKLLAIREIEFKERR
jgi:hypothetical protein